MLGDSAGGRGGNRSDVCAHVATANTESDVVYLEYR